VKLDYQRLPARKSDQRMFVPDIGKAQRLLRWRPQVSLEEGVARMAEWVGQNC
jgi:CDP-paratose 2-epimerase